MQYNTHRIKWVVFHISIGGFLFCYNLSILNSSIENISCSLSWNSHKTLYFILSNFFMPLGAFVGGLFTGSLSSTYGRRYTVIFADILMLLSTVLVLIPFTETFLIGRFVGGVASGIFLTILPVFISEITPESLIPTYGPFVQISTDVGLLSAYLICLPLPTDNCSSDWMNNWWRVMLALPGAVCCYQLWYFCVVFPYDTPVWLMERRRRQEALKVFEYLFPDEDPEEILSQREKGEETDGLLDNSSSYEQIFTGEKHRKLLGIAVALAVIQQLSGINVAVIYSTYVFKEVGNNEMMSRIYTAAAGGVFLFASLMSIPLLNRFGRKSLILFGEVAIAATMLALGFATLFELSSWVSVVLVVVFYVFYAFSLGAALWTYLGEILNERLMSVSTSVNFFLVCVISLMFPITAEGFAIFYPFFFFATIMLVSLWFTSVYLIETRNKSHKEILAELEYH